MKLNDGIFHPVFNPGGWRCRWTGEANITWDKHIDGLELDGEVSCFEPRLIYQGTDAAIRNASGRRDGLVLEDGASAVTYNTEEW